MYCPRRQLYRVRLCNMRLRLMLLLLLPPLLMLLLLLLLLQVRL